MCGCRLGIRQRNREMMNNIADVQPLFVTLNLICHNRRKMSQTQRFLSQLNLFCRKSNVFCHNAICHTQIKNQRNMSQNSYFAYVSKLQINTYMNRQETVYSYFLVSRSFDSMAVLFDFVGKESV